MNTVLTIAVPTFNMERWLEKNLSTYCHPALEGRLEVLCLNNASEDASSDIIRRFVKAYPGIFHLCDRSSRGYGSSINEAIAKAQGRYFRIVDADDWVATAELVKLVDRLESCSADVVLTDYQIVNMQNGSMTAITAAQKGIAYGQTLLGWQECIRLLPSIHSTTYKTSLLRDSGFFMQDNLFFVDEEYVVLPYLSAKNAICYPFDVYRYQVANPEQSTSPKNRAHYYRHRERILRRLVEAYRQAERNGADQDALSYCFERIKRGIGDHFTTLYMYRENRIEGRKLAAAWRRYIRSEGVAFWPLVQKKADCLAVLNFFHVGLEQYQGLKKLLGQFWRSA